MSRRPPRKVGALPEQRPFGQVPRLYAPTEILAPDRLHAIHQAALRVLAETGMKVLDAGARDRFRSAGAQVQDEMVRFDPAMVMQYLSAVPQSFSLLARNSAKSLHFGGNDIDRKSVV